MIALVLTPLVRLFSFKIDAVDYPKCASDQYQAHAKRGWTGYRDCFFNCDSRVYSYADIHHRTNQKLPILYLAGRRSGMDYRSYSLIDDVKSCQPEKDE